MPYTCRTYGAVIVIRWIGTPQRGEPSAVYTAVRAARAVAKRDLVYIGIHDVDSREPIPEARDEALDGWGSASESISTAYFVLASSSLVAGVQRSFYQGMTFLARLRGVRGTEKIRWVGSVDDALTAEARRLPMPVEAFRDQLRRDGLLPEISGAIR